MVSVVTGYFGSSGNREKTDVFAFSVKLFKIADGIEVAGSLLCKILSAVKISQCGIELSSADIFKKFGSVHKNSY